MKEIILNFLTFRNQMKLYHWKTKSHPRHEAVDKFLTDFDDKIDKFVEELLGGREHNIDDSFEINFISLTDASAKTYVINYRNWVRDELPKLLNENETNLMNIKDEILGDINKMIYLFRFK